MLLPNGDFACYDFCFKTPARITIPRTSTTSKHPNCHKMPFVRNVWRVPVWSLTWADSGYPKSMPITILRASLKHFKNNGFRDFRPSWRASGDAISSRNAFVRNVWRVSVWRLTWAPWLTFFGAARPDDFLHTSNGFLTKTTLKAPKCQYFAWRVAKLEAVGRLRKVPLKMRFWINSLCF